MIKGTPLTPDNTEELEFRVQKFDFNEYQIMDEELDVKGILRIASVPYKLLKAKINVGNKPQFFMQFANVVSFVNKGKYGASNPEPLTSEEMESIEKIEVTDRLDTLIEPYNIYITINTKPYFAIRAKSNLIKAEIIKGRYDVYGNPMFLVEVNPAISYAYAKDVHQ
jgi:hypothetical protein